MAGIPSGPLLLVSPHLDDAALSCAAVLERGEPVDVLTVCAGSPDPPRRGWWDVECGFSSSTESIPTRLHEEEAAFAGTAHLRRTLSLLELQYVEQRSDEEARTIAAAIASWLGEHEEGILALPAGAGCRSLAFVRRLRRLVGRPCHPPPHPDHLYVRDAALSSRPPTILLYEELPYLWGGAADREAHRIAVEGGWDDEQLVVAVDPAAKAARIAAYGSQVPHLSPPEDRLDDPATLPREERYWLLRRSSSSP